MTTATELHENTVHTRDRLEEAAEHLEQVRAGEAEGDVDELEDELREEVLEITRTLKQSIEGGRGWTTDEVTVDVLLCTGGPAYGVTFNEGSHAHVWHQDWFTTKHYVKLGHTAQDVLRDIWAIDIATEDLD